MNMHIRIGQKTQTLSDPIEWVDDLAKVLLAENNVKLL